MSTVEATASVSQPKTRAQVLRERVQIDIAENYDGEEIARVLRDNGINLRGADWSAVNPHWLIAAIEGRVVGCCQVLISKPIGFVEFLFADPALPFKMRLITIRKLIFTAAAALQTAGCQYVGSAVDSSNKKFAKVLENLDCKAVGQATLYARRIA